MANRLVNWFTGSRQVGLPEALGWVNGQTQEPDMTGSVHNLIGNTWSEPHGAGRSTLTNPATGEALTVVVDSTSEDAAAACRAAASAFPAWSAMPMLRRCRILFHCKELLERYADDLARCLVRENGKVMGEAQGEVRRGIEVVEHAAGMTSLAKGDYFPEIASDIDGYMLREPLGVVVGACPFNFPAMIPMWMFPMAIATGNTFVLKPSDQCPMTANLLASIMLDGGLPPGVLNIVHGGRTTFEALIDHPQTAAVSFVGSTPAAQSVWSRATTLGKRVQALGGAKNVLIAMPDADKDATIEAIIGSACGCAGQRCMATSILLLVGDTGDLLDRVVEKARGLRLGDGLVAGTGMGPLVSKAALQRVTGLIGDGIAEGARLLLDGRGARVEGLPDGHFLGATILDQVTSSMRVGREEIFGPVLSVMRAPTLEKALDIANASELGNGASIFTASGAAARRFRTRIQCGMVGINTGVPAPMAFISFGGWKRSLYGDLKVQGTEAIDFYTRRKAVIERWFGTGDVWGK